MDDGKLKIQKWSYHSVKIMIDKSEEIKITTRQRRQQQPQ